MLRGMSMRRGGSVIERVNGQLLIGARDVRSFLPARLTNYDLNEQRALHSLH